jgi:hypothetical protein
MTVSAQQPPRSYGDLVTAARSDDRDLVTGTPGRVRGRAPERAGDPLALTTARHAGDPWMPAGCMTGWITANKNSLGRRCADEINRHFR